MADWTFDEVGVGRLSLLINLDNEASSAVTGRCGFTREGVLRACQPIKGARPDPCVLGGRWDPDMRPVVRGRFCEVGPPALSFDGDPEDFGVGVNAVPVSTEWQPPQTEGRFFTFRPD